MQSWGWLLVWVSVLAASAFCSDAINTGVPASNVPAMPRAYRIGTDNSFPYHQLNANGQPEGMAAEVIQEAARRAGVPLRWEIHKEGPIKALTSKSVDLWPLFGLQTKLFPQLHFTAPYLSNT